MAQQIQELFLDPPIAIARLGGSTTPVAAYAWVESPNPRSTGETTIEPRWSLVVEADGTVSPSLPASIAFRDGSRIRPVCPFIELWAMVGEPNSDSRTWKALPVTPELLSRCCGQLARVTVTVDARNFKASRRTGDPALQFGTFPPVQVKGDHHQAVALLASSPPGLPERRRMIPSDQPIPLGSVQVLRSRAQPAPDPNRPWTQLVNGQPIVNVATFRLRFTPAHGHFYGPPDAGRRRRTTPRGKDKFAPVDEARAFLNAHAGWAGANVQAKSPDTPSDTYDGADMGGNASIGVVDDTCEARIQVSVAVGSRRTLEAFATVFVGPPDFAPDRRPFVSLADELNDRAADSDLRSREMGDGDRDAWVQDLFQRVFETASLMNVDRWRRQKAITLSGKRLAAKPIPNDHTIDPERAMSGRDVLRNESHALPSPSHDVRLPLADWARTRHRDLSDLNFLRDFISQNPGRLSALIRAPYEAERPETSSGIGTTTMRMPPFMRSSNAGPLTLTFWQYELLMSWVKKVETQPIVNRLQTTPAALTLSPAADRRRNEVLSRLARIAPSSGDSE